MKFEALPNAPRTKLFVRQADLYAENGVEAEFSARLPFATNLEYFFNVDNLRAAGIDPMGFARQVDQVTIENLGNTFAAQIKRAASRKEDLPTQESFDALQAAYDFSGVRAPSSEEGMTAEERITRSQIRKLLRSYINNGVLTDVGDGEGNILLSITRVQTGPESTKNPPELPAGSLELSVFEDVISAAYENEDIQVEDTEGRTGVLPFSEPPEWDEDENPASMSAIVEQARQLAQIEIDKSRAVAAASPRGMKVRAV